MRSRSIFVRGLATLAAFAMLCANALCGAENEIILDDGNPGFSQNGFRVETDEKSHGGSCLVSEKLPDKTFARYQPSLKGEYDVYMFWRDFPGRDTNAPWTVFHTRGRTLQRFSQCNDPGWHFHGTYHLDEKSYVELAGPSRVYGSAVADAVKFVPAAKRIFKRTAKDTLTPVSLNLDDELHFTLRDGSTRRIKLLATRAEIAEGTPQKIRKYTFSAALAVDDQRVEIARVIPAQESFYEPLEIAGMRVWLDAVSAIFKDDGGFMREKDGDAGGPVCRPTRKARLVVNDLHDRVCPETLVWWYPETAERLDIRRCYRGEDCWMGPYDGVGAHGGLDLNMRSGTPLFAPIAFDDHYLFDSLREGDNNNRWRGVRKWPNGAVWWLQAHHLNKMVIDEHGPLKAGTLYAETAGVHIGVTQHTHFAFRIFEEGESHWIDPWIFFWQTFKDNPKDKK